jgi:hypothetical protein
MHTLRVAVDALDGLTPEIPVDGATSKMTHRMAQSAKFEHRREIPSAK